MALVRKALVTKVSTLVKLKFYFPRVGGSRDLCPGAKSPCHQVTSPGEINILFSLGFSTWSPGLFAPKLRSREGDTLLKIKINFTRVEALVTRTLRTKAKIA